jgi:hypothetical protein
MSYLANLIYPKQELNESFARDMRQALAADTPGLVQVPCQHWAARGKRSADDLKLCWVVDE